MNIIERVISRQVLDSKAYPVAAVNSDMLKLDAMELPADIPENLRQAWAETLAAVAVNRYPPAQNAELERLLRQVFDIEDSHGIVLGNGSDELIQIILLACARPDAVIMAPAPTFVMYEIGAKFLGLRYESVETNADFSLNLPAFLQAVKTHNPSVIFLANPNNPTGAQYPIEQLEEIVKTAQGLVVIDEAYLAYSEGTAKALAGHYDNVVMMRTLSKTGFAGLRFGYLFGKTSWTDELNKVRPPYNVNVLTQAGILFALKHYPEIAAQSEVIISEREKLRALFAGWKECNVLPSQANFLLLQVPDADNWFNRLKEQGVLVKNLSHAHPLLKNYLRLTVSNPAENTQLVQVLENCRAD